MALQTHQAGSPANIVIVHNTILTDGKGIEVRSVVGPVLIANNAIYSQSGNAIRLISGSLSLVTVAGNVGHGGLSGASSGYTEGKGIGADFVAAHYGVPPIDVFPKSGSALIGAGERGPCNAARFQRHSRAAAPTTWARIAVGASGNPGWQLAAGFKTSGNIVRPNPPTNVTAQ